MTKILGTTAILGMATAFAQPAAAMTCAEFLELDKADRTIALSAVEGADSGREATRETARGDDDMISDTDATDLDIDADHDGGREAARESARGEDVMRRVVETCESSPGMDVVEARHPNFSLDD